MPLQSALLGTYGIEHSGDTMRDIIPHHIFHKECGEPDADDREHKIKPVERLHIEFRGQQMLYEVDSRMKYECRNSRKHTHKECKDKRKLLVRHLLHSPFYDLIYSHKRPTPKPLP